MLSNAPPLAAASGLTVSSPSTTQANLSWSAPTGATGYSVERSADGSTGWTAIGTVGAATTFTDTGLAAGTTYSYRVQATNGDSLAPYSSPASVTTFPGAPDGLTATFISPSRIDFSWTNHAANAHYTVIMQSTDGTNWNTNAGLATDNATSCSATGPFNGATTYYFRAMTFTTSGQVSASSAVSSVTTPAFPNQPQLNVSATGTDQSVTFAWIAASGAAGYRIERSTDNGADWVTAGSVASGVTTFTDDGLAEATSYEYRVFATNAVGDSAPSAVRTFPTSPKAPTDLIASAVPPRRST